jgi:hypothetical protein
MQPGSRPRPANACRAGVDRARVAARRVSDSSFVSLSVSMASPFNARLQRLDVRLAQMA